MNKIFPYIKTLMRFALVRRADDFERAVASPEEAQTQFLRQVIQEAAQTEYGKSFGLCEDDTYAEFSKKIPIVTYDDLKPWVERQMKSNDSILCAEKVKIFEKTSGSSGASKYIPYAPQQFRTFHSLLAVWFYDLFSKGPKFQTGKTFFSLSQPFAKKEAAETGTKIGLDSDFDYLPGIANKLLNKVFVSPKGLNLIQDSDNYKRVLLTAMMSEVGLEFVSIWNPTYLLAAMEFAEEHVDQIKKDLLTGELTVEGRLFKYPVRDNKFFGQAFKEVKGRLTIHWPSVWPNMKLISCWADGSAGLFIDGLKKKLPGVMIQGKGLLATEAVVTVPLLNAPAPVPFIINTFLEFIDEKGSVKTVTQIKEGKTYEVVLTHRSGLLRYRIGDRVQVHGKYRNTPCLKFVGRTNSTSDLVGEKLSQDYLLEILKDVAKDEFTFLVPILHQDLTPYYACVTSASPKQIEKLEEAIESELQKAHHYRQARLLKQLGPVRAFHSKNARETYTDYHTNKGMKWGDIKFRPILTEYKSVSKTSFKADFLAKSDVVTGKNKRIYGSKSKE